jgi:hypothetical protein
MSAAVRRFTGSPAGRALQAAEVSAQARAMATGRPVTIASATTPTFTLAAEPDGQFRGTNTLQPARFWRHRAWVTINTALRHGPRSTWVPIAVPDGVVLFGGGTGPVATLTAPDGHRTFLRFPGPVSAPDVSGSTATYHAAGGRTLRLTVTVQGGITEAVTAPRRAIAPGLRDLRPGSSMSAGSARALTGTWSAAALQHAAFKITSPVVVQTGPPASAAATQVAMTVTPASPPACKNPGTVSACDNNTSGNWTETEEWDPDPADPKTTFYDVPNVNGYGEGIGDDVYDCSACIGRAYFQMPLGELNGNMYVNQATLYDQENYGSDEGCGDDWSAQLYDTGTLDSSATWDSPPVTTTNVASNTSVLPSDDDGGTSSSGNPGDSCTADLSFNLGPSGVTSIMQDAVSDGWSNWNFKIDGDEAAGAGDPTSVADDGPCAGGDNGTVNGVSSYSTGYNCGWMQISDDPEVITYYDYAPPAPSESSLEESPSPVDYPGKDDNGCGGLASLVTPPYLDQTSVQLSGDVYSNWSGEPVKGYFTLANDVENSNVTLPQSGWEPSAETSGKGESTGADVLASGSPADIPVTGLTSGDAYSWLLYSEVDGEAWSDDGSVGPIGTPAPNGCVFVVDTAAPQLPTITSATINASGSVTLTLFDSQQQNTGCGFSPCFQSGIHDFEYQLNNNQFATSPATVPATGLTTNGSGIGSLPGGSYTGPIVSSIQAASGTDTAMCLDDASGSTTAGNPIDISNCDGTSEQDWTYSDSELQTEGMCADAAANGTKEGTLVELEACSTSTAGETWTQGPDGELVNSNSGDCLNDPGNNTTPGTQQVIWGCVSTSNEDYGNATGTVTVPYSHWGTYSLYVEAQTGAGVPSAMQDYPFYVPSTGTITPGDVTGDGVPDLLATTSGGGLYVYPGISGGDTLAAPVQASDAGQSPDGGSDWNDYLITHRGSLTGADTDDLYAYNASSGILDEYTNADQTTTAFPATLPYNCDQVETNLTNQGCTASDVEPILKPGTAAFGSGYDGTSWSSADLTQILAVGNPDTSSTSPTGLLTVEDGNLWYYPGDGGGALADPTELGTGWGNMTLIAPGYEGLQDQLQLWARDNTSGDLYSYQFTDDDGTWTLSNSGTAATITPEDTSTGATQITLPSGVPALTAASYPTIASAGDAAEPGALYLVDTSGNIWVIAGNPNPASAADALEGTLTQVGTAPSGTTIMTIS